MFQKILEFIVKEAIQHLLVTWCVSNWSRFSHRKLHGY